LGSQTKFTVLNFAQPEPQRVVVRWKVEWPVFGLLDDLLREIEITTQVCARLRYNRTTAEGPEEVTPCVSAWLFIDSHPQEMEAANAMETANRSANLAAVPFTFAEWMAKARQSGYKQEHFAAMSKLEQAGQLLESLVPLELRDTEVLPCTSLSATKSEFGCGSQHPSADAATPTQEPETQKLLRAIALLDEAQDDLDKSYSAVDTLVATFLPPPEDPQGLEPELVTVTVPPVKMDLNIRSLWGSTTLQLSATGQVSASLPFPIEPELVTVTVPPVKMDLNIRSLWGSTTLQHTCPPATSPRVVVER
jgi:hypothetical protein